ncbi:zinc finger and BTB domain-containing protein 11-like [Gossypium australe]|uniref:Zinc finger and BTB domain-containing protein 11-like n=1 Tax=Gossypium australe TaxID=47621 RepID=A0A5B6X1P8_9ROSI|nr:zinc finger and BTB domain-containing protein 11-like [Gossypium australe]
MTDLRVMFARSNASLLPWIKQVEDDKTKDFGLNVDDILCFRWRYCVLNDNDLKQSILWEAHSSSYVMHLGGNKMYWDLRELYLL